jgi:hypothetical protein
VQTRAIASLRWNNPNQVQRVEISLSQPYGPPSGDIQFECIIFQFIVKNKEKDG